jgi:hypothetical protein
MQMLDIQRRDDVKKIFTFDSDRRISRSVIACAVAAVFALPHAAQRKMHALTPEMILDAQNEFSTGQALAATGLSTNVIDLALARSIGNGEPMVVVFNVTVLADVVSGDETYQFDVETATDAAITAGRKLLGRRRYTVAAAAPDEAASLLAAGFKFVIPIPQAALSESARFLAVRYTLGGTTPSITISAHLMPASMVEVGQVTFAKGYTIS